MLQLKKFSDIPVSTREEAREFRPHPEEPRFASCSGGILSLRGRERIPGVPVPSQEETLFTGKARGTQGSGQHSQSHPDASVQSRETCFPCSASTIKPGIDSHHGGTWDSLWESLVGKPRGTALWDSVVGKPRGKALRESPLSLDPPEGKPDMLLQLERKAHVHASNRDED